MELEDLQQRLKRLLMDRCGVKEERITSEATLQGDLGLDSLDAVELAISIEDEFNLKILDEDMKKLSTVADAVAIIRRLLAENRASAGGAATALSPAGS